MMPYIFQHVLGARKTTPICRCRRSIHPPWLLLPVVLLVGAGFLGSGRGVKSRRSRSRSDAVGALEAVFVTGTIGSEEDAPGLVGFLLVILVVLVSWARSGWRGGSARRGRTPGAPAGAARRHAERAALDGVNGVKKVLTATGRTPGVADRFRFVAGDCVRCCAVASPDDQRKRADPFRLGSALLLDRVPCRIRNAGALVMGAAVCVPPRAS